MIAWLLSVALVIRIAICTLRRLKPLYFGLTHLDSWHDFANEAARRESTSWPLFLHDEGQDTISVMNGR